MNRITSTNVIAGIPMMQYSVSNEAEAETVRAGRMAYLYHSKINNGLYLYIPQDGEK